MESCGLVLVANRMWVLSPLSFALICFQYCLAVILSEILQVYVICKHTGAIRK